MTDEAVHVFKVAMITIAMLVAPFLVVVIAAWFRGSLAPPPDEAGEGTPEETGLYD